MIIGEVIGTVVSTRKCDNLVGHKLLLINKLFSENKDVFVASDKIGAGIGEYVLITQNSSAQYAIDGHAPIDAVVVGILDDLPKL